MEHYGADPALIHARGGGGALRAAGFAARTLPGGYAGGLLLRGLVAYLARKR